MSETTVIDAFRHSQVVLSLSGLSPKVYEFLRSEESRHMAVLKKLLTSSAEILDELINKNDKEVIMKNVTIEI